MTLSPAPVGPIVPITCVAPVAPITPAVTPEDIDLVKSAPTLIFQTFLTPSMAVEHSFSFVYGEQSLTLDKFLEAFRTKHKLEPTRKFLDMQFTIDGTIIGIDLEDPDKDWDWEVAMNGFEKNGKINKVIVRVDI